MSGRWSRPRLKSAVNLLFICVAVYMSDHLVQSSAVDSTLFVIHPSSSFTQGTVLHTFQPQIVGQNSVYGIEFQQTCPNDTFSLDQSTGELSITRTIDYSQSSLEPMCVQDESLDEEHFITLETFYCFVTIDSRVGILVVVNVIPELLSVELIFPQTFYSSHVAEGVVNATVTITGIDSSLQAVSMPIRDAIVPSYRIIGQHSGNFTVIQSQTNCRSVPVLVTSRPLYRSQQSFYEVILEAYVSSVSTTTTIGVRLLDTNDQSPQFVDTPESFDLPDNTPIGMEFGQLTAVDMDAGLSGKVRYSVSDSLSLFSIHPLTGSLFSIAPLGSTMSPSLYLLSVSAIDLGVPPQLVETNVTVFIDDSIVFPPVIIIHSLGPVPEREPMGLVVGTIEVMHSNSSDVSITLTNNGPCDCFRLANAVTTANGTLLYDIIVSGMLDFESAPNGIHGVVLNATDDMFSTVEHRNIELINVNEAPTFPESAYMIEVFEGIPVGSEIGRITASDPDQGSFGVLSYNISSGDLNRNHLAIHSPTGTIYTTRELDYDSVSSIQIIVTAQDSGTEEAMTMLVVSVLDRNNNIPVFTSAMNSTVTIPETNGVNQPIFHFTVSDLDSGCSGAVEYSIIHAEPQAFRIDSFSGLLFPMNDSSLDYERFQFAKVVVRATDLGSISSYSVESNLFVILTDVDDEAPVIDPIECSCFIQEGLSAGSNCFPLSAQDEDSAVIQFSIMSGNEFEIFRIDPTNGVVTTTQTLNRAIHSSFVLTIIASDSVQASQPMNLTVIVVDVNGRPTYPPTTTIIAPQDLNVGDFVGNVAAMDSDVGFNGITLYNFQSGTSSIVMDTFFLEHLSGDLFTRSSLNSASYTFTVVASDLTNSASSATTTVTISVSGMKNNPPSFAASTDRRTVPADFPINSIVAQLSAVDGDSGRNGELTYSVVAGNNSGLFTVTSSGAITVSAQSLSNSAGDVYTLNISVTDDGLQPLRAYQEFIIEVYPTTVDLTFTQLVHNPAVGVCHFLSNTVIEMTLSNYLIATLPVVGSQRTTYRILPSTFSSAFLIQALPDFEDELRVEMSSNNVDVFTNREVIFITLRAEYGLNFHLCSVTVLIQDINNNPALFVSDNISVQVYSGTPTGSSIYQLDVVDADTGSNAQTQFRLATSGSPFTLDRDSGILSVSSSLDQPSYTLTATVTDRMFSSLQTSTATVIVTVLQTTNAPPVFPASIPPVNISETTPTGHVVAMLSVSDTDTGVHGENRFCIVSGNDYGLFRITSAGQLLVHRQLDFESYPQYYNLMVRAYDSSENPQYRDTSVNINIVDENDEVPVFSTNVYTATVMENQASGVSVITVSAVDRDDGSNGDIIFSLQGNFPFSINSESGLITTMSSLDREVVSAFTITLVATDQAASISQRLTSTAELMVFVIDENDEDPTFDVAGTGMVTVQENAAIGSEVIQLVATDLDEGANSVLKYSIVSGNDDFTFSIDPWTGSLSIARSLDFESSTRSYTLGFQVRDLGMPPRSASSTLQLIFDVEDVNDNYPVFSSDVYNCSFMETTTMFSSNCQVSATDADGTLSSVTYSIVNPGGLPFQIDEQSGILSILGVTDAEIISRYIIKVQATDSGLPRLSTTSLVVITVDDVNDNIAVIDSVSSVNIPELIPDNSFLFFAHAFDRDISDENSEIVYQILGGTNSDKFRVHRLTGAVYLDGNLDAEESEILSLTVHSTDPVSGASNSATFMIQVVDINENLLPPTFPVELNPSIIAISRAAARGAAVTTLSAEDEEGGTISYHIIGGTGYGFFDVGTSDGAITLSLPVSSVEGDELSLIIMADDGGRFPLTTEFRLTVVLERDENAKPFFVAPVFYASPPESTGSEQIFTHVRAEVRGYIDTNVCYSITGGNEASNFAINASTGAVYKSQAGILNREFVTSYNLTITATKPGVMNTSTALLIIELTDANDFRPLFVSEFNISVFENHEVGSSQPFARAFAIDNDVGDNGRLSYSIQSSTSVPFAISETTGYIHLTSPLNAASISEYSITVQARDHGDPVLDGSITLTINVILPAPVGTPAPLFLQIGQQAISEGTSTGTKITTISPQNSPSNTLLYRFVDNTDTFAITPNSGEVYLTRPLDRETEPSSMHTISVTDGQNMVNVLFSVIVTEINEHRPQFTQEEFQVTVTENVPSSLTFGSVTAPDPESGNVAYSVVDSLDPRSLSLFGVSQNGDIYTISSEVDREEIPVHILTVAVRDFDNPPLYNFARVIIDVLDENDNSPTFENTEIFIPEDTPVSEIIFRVSAFDPDEGENARVLYSLVTSNPFFSVNATSGDIILTSSLDAETQLQHTLVISLSNPNSHLSSQVSITVNVTDVLDSTPLLINPGTVIVQENLPVFTFVASVANISDTSRPVFYSIVSGNALGHFFVEPLTGSVRTSSQLDREMIQSYQLTVQGAFESDFETNVTFTVAVGDVNDQTPQFPSSYLSFSIPESSPQHVPLFSLNVTDLDETSNVLYVIVDGLAAEVFSVDSSGRLMLTQNLDREFKFSSITFDIYVIDTAYPNSYSSAVMHIEVVDSNDNPPEFEQSEYTFTISIPTRVNFPISGVLVQATDPDEGVNAEVRYEISGGNGTSKFGINHLSGEITVTNNYQLQPRYMLVVTAIDGGGRRSTVDVIILIKGCGFHNLLFLPATFTVELRENIVTETNVITPANLNILYFDEPTTVVFSLPIFNPVFNVDPVTGRIFTVGNIDREESEVHYLVLHATDTSNPQRLAQAEIKVTVLDENDNPPVFDQSQAYMANILNTASPDDEVIRIMATDDDIGTNSDILYSLVTSEHSGSFRIDADSGGIFVDSPLNTVQLGSSVTLTAMATDMGDPPRSAEINVVIDIVDSNAPRFTRSTYREEVMEGIALGSPIVTVAVNVSSNNPSITFRLDSDDPFIPLSLGFFDGVVTVVDPGFDFESVQSYTVTVLAEDSTTSLTGQASLEIVILDENDNTPIFDAPGNFYTDSIDENVDTGTFVLQVSANDNDSPTNSEITFRLNPNSPFLDTFSVDGSTGVIRTIGGIDYERYPVYELEIMAEDSGVPQRTGLATVRIITNNLNDNPPLFTSKLYEATASENAGVGTNLRFVTATDPDGLNPITYGIVPTGEGHENFEISSIGLITITQSLSGSSVFTYMLNISASDGELISYATVVIELEDSNDNSPMFNQSVYTGSVVEGSPGDRYVTQVFATDRDRGNNAEITYSSSSTPFSVDSQSGVITTATGVAAIDREVTPSCQFIVVARDGGGRTGTALVEVTVVDVNDNAPRFLRTMYTESVIESANLQTPVLSLNVSDPDEGENSRLVFSIFPINVSPDQFPFNIDSTGLLSVSLGLNFDVVRNYTFVVSVRDNGMGPLFAAENATVLINIEEDVSNNPPQFVGVPYMFSVPETVGDMETIGVIAVDETAIENCIIFYSILPQIGDAGRFEIDPNLITEMATISRAGTLVTGMYTIIVEAQCISPTDFSTRLTSNRVTVMIEVYDLNSDPTFVSRLYSGRIPEDTRPITRIPVHVGIGATGPPVNFVAEDTDEGVNGTVTYFVPNSRTTMVPFDIGSTTGELQLTGELDFETVPGYNFVVMAMDGGTPPLNTSTVVFISVTDVNDSPPEFDASQYSVEIPEDTPLNVTVLTVTANDNDTSDVIMYFLSGSEFVIDANTGEISTAVPLDRETEIIYTLQAVVSDGRFSDSITVVISVSDVNDNAPVFNESLLTFTLVENHPTGETIVQVFATEADEGENAVITYSIAEQPDNGEVTIDSSTGEVSFLVSPDFEISPRLEFQIVASDNGGLQDFATVAINLLDENDNAPMFTSQNYVASVIEHSAAVSNVIRVEASDADSGINGTVTYMIEGSDANNFQISSTGVITTQRVFDREINPFYDFRVIASDYSNKSSSAMVHVNITDINDQRPMFPQSTYQVSVSEDEPANFVILMTIATDDDVGANARITYALSGENSNEFQRVSHNNGSVSIILANELNRERLSSYNLTLRAIDGGIPEMDDTAIIMVTVLDVNDNCPEFREPRYSETIPENITIGTTILSVEAFDRDLGGQTQLVFSIRDGSLAPEISIHPSNGYISIANSLDFETRRVYTLMVDVSDGEVSCMPTPTIVNISLTDINDNPPSFFGHEPIYTIEENNDPNIALVTFDVEDRDTVTVRGRITFSIESGDIDDTFSIGATDGVLSVQRSLDRETVDSYNLVIAAADNGSPDLTGTTSITIIVSDVNDNAPTGGRQDIYIYLLDGVAPLINLGHVFVNDSDLVNDHSFVIQDADGPLEIDANNGMIRIGTTTPGLGIHTFRVLITDSDNMPAMTNITARIQSIAESTLIESSFVMQLDNISPQDFTDRVLAQFLLRVSEIVSSVLRTSSGELPVEIQVLSIQPSMVLPQNLDITVATRNQSDATYVHPELIQHIIKTNRDGLESYLNVSIHTEFVDLCSDTACTSSSLVCSNTYSYNSTNSVSFGTRSVTYLGLTLNHTTSCGEVMPPPCEGIVCPEPSFCSSEREEEVVCYDGCSAEPCRNGGTCIQQKSGYYCSCPEGYNGRNCEQTSATFTEGTYAVFPSVKSRLEGSFSIDFNTDKRNGLLAFVGRYDNDFRDFISVELIDGRPSLRVSYGPSDHKQLTLLNSLLNDQRWHTVSVQYNSTFVSISTTTYDPYTKTNNTNAVTGSFHSLDLGGPLLLGYLPSNYNYSSRSFFQFVGCMRNVVVNNELMDFSSPLLSVGLAPGCDFTDAQCDPNPCLNGAKCIGSWTSFTCDCTPQFAGTTCKEGARTASFSGNNFISYEIKNPSIVRPLRQTSPGSSSFYITAQNIISFSLATKEDSGTVLQLGDSITSKEYALIEVVNGQLQFRYNLGSGEAVLSISSVNVNDARFHNVSLLRTEQSVELLVDEMFVNRTISPGSEATLDILSGHFYLGATINVIDGTLSNGLRGCITGLRLNRKEVPVGGENGHFTTLKISNGVQNGCPIGTLIETPQSDTNVYTALGVTLAVICIISFVFVMICVIIQWQKDRTRTHTYNPPSREGSRRRSRAGSRSSGNGEFAWHQPPTYRRNLDSPQGDYRTSPGPEDHQPDIRMNDISPTFSFSTKSRYPPPFPVTDVSTNIAETVFSESNDTTDLRSRNNSISSSKRRHRLPPIQEGFSVINQSNPGFLEESPQMNHNEFHDGPSQIPTTGGQQPSRHCRSPSAGLISLLSEISDGTLDTSIEEDVDKYIQKRKEVANIEIEELNVDSMTHYKDEGPYDPLGSIGSLYDFVRDIERPDLNQSTSADRSILLAPQSPSLSSPGRRSRAAHSQSLRPKSPSSGQPAMPHELSSDDDQLKSNFTREWAGQRSGKRSSKRGSQRRTDHSTRMNSIMDKFHNISAGNRPMDSVETRLI